MGGLLVAGLLLEVPGAEVLSPGEEPWVRLDARDCQQRPGSWIPQLIGHTTQGIWPQRIVEGSPPNPGTRAEQVARWWSTSKERGGAQIVVDGKLVACLVDVVKVEAYHATKANPWSIGLEMVQEPDGTIYRDTIETAADVFMVLGDALGIPAQTTRVPYRRNTIIERMRYGSRDVVGMLGHRDCAWMFPEWLPEDKRQVWPKGYADRGRGDPGDEFYAALRRRGAMAFDYDAREDLAWWQPVQRALVADGERLIIDGVCGPATVAALRKRGLWNGGRFTERPIP